MKKLLLLFLIATNISFAQYSENQEIPDEEYSKKIDSINNTFKYQEGTIILQNGLAKIEVPKGYKFLDEKQSAYVLTDLWGNPPEEVLGMLFPKNTHPAFSDSFTYAVEINYSDEG